MMCYRYKIKAKMSAERKKIQTIVLSLRHLLTEHTSLCRHHVKECVYGKEQFLRISHYLPKIKNARVTSLIPVLYRPIDLGNVQPP